MLFIIFTRLYNLSINPRWYLDEAYFVNMEYNMAYGDVRQGAIKYPFGLESTPHLPLYYYISGFLMRFFNNRDIFYPRFISFLCTIGIIFPLLMIGKLLFNEKVALLGLAIFALHKFPLIFNRWGVAYNAGMFFNVWTLYALVSFLKFRKAGSLIAAAIFAGLFSVSSFYGVVTLLFVILFVLFVSRRSLIYVLPIAIAPFLLFSVWMMVNTQGQFLKDFIRLFFAVAGSGEKETVFEQVGTFIKSALLFPSYDLVYFLSIVGFFFLKGQQNIISLFILPLGLIIIKKQGFDTRTSYNSVLYLPMLHLSMASLLFILYDRVKIGTLRLLENKPESFKKIIVTVVLIIALLPFSFLVIRDIIWVSTRIPTTFDGIGAVQNYDDTMSVVNFVNFNTDSNKDMVIAPELISWLIDCETVNLYQMVLSLGYETKWHAKIPETRWAYKVDYKRAKYLIINYTNRGFTLQQENMDKILEIFKEEDWKLILQQGEYSIFLNPRFAELTSGDNK